MYRWKRLEVATDLRTVAKIPMKSLTYSNFRVLTSYEKRRQTFQHHPTISFGEPEDTSPSLIGFQMDIIF